MKRWVRSAMAFHRLVAPICVVFAFLAPVSGSASTRLFGFAATEAPWVAVNDGVMGGVSSGSMVVKSGVATFAGRVRTENNGGFASVQSNTGVVGVSAQQSGFVARVRGDGRAYQFTVDTADGWFWARIDPPKRSWTTIHIPFATLTPRTRFGELMKRAAFDGSPSVKSVGLLIANKRAEYFSLAIDWIDVEG